MPDKQQQKWLDITESSTKRRASSEPGVSMRWVKRAKQGDPLGELIITRALAEQLGWTLPRAVRILVSDDGRKVRFVPADKGKKFALTCGAGQIRIRLPWVIETIHPTTRLRFEMVEHPDLGPLTALEAELPPWALRPAPAAPQAAAAPAPAPAPAAKPAQGAAARLLSAPPPPVVLPDVPSFKRGKAAKEPETDQGEDDKREAMGLFDAGWGARQVAEEFGVDLTVASQWATEHREAKKAAAPG